MSSISPGASLDSEIAALRTDVTTLQQQVAVLQSAQPKAAPAPTATGLALYQLGDTLPGCSHLLDGTYAVVCGDWEDAALLATCGQAGAETYAYTVSTSGVAPGSEGEFVILDANPNGGTIPNSLTPTEYANKCVALVNANPGLSGVQLDNCLSNIPGIAAALATVSGIFKANGVKFCANVGSYVAGQSGSDDGTLWQAWAAQIAPYLDRLMLENWQTPSNASPPTEVRKRGTNWDQHWDTWQACVSVAPGKFFAINYGPDSFGVYGRASMLTAPGADPGNVFTHNTTGPSDPDPYGQAWMKANPVPTVDPVAGTATL